MSQSYIHQSELSYDPDDINIRLQHFRVYELVFMIDSKFKESDLDVLNEYIEESKGGEEDSISILGDDGLQRNSGLWNDVQKSQFIESLMIKLPIPLFYFDGSTKPWNVIDGLQRLSTLLSFLSGKLVLKGLEYLSKECENKTIEHIPKYLSNRVLDAEVTAYVINPGTPTDVKFNIFRRINTGGLRLNGQEIRNALFRGKPADFLRKLSEKEIFLDAANNKLNPKRMLDREYANRFLAFQIFGYEQYSGKMDIFLYDALQKISRMDDQSVSELEARFDSAMERAQDIFGKTAFYRRMPDGSTGRVLNKALFDTISWNFAELDDRGFELIKSNKAEFLRQYVTAVSAEDIQRSINDTTGTKSAVTVRFSVIEKFLSRFINDFKNKTEEF